MPPRLEIVAEEILMCGLKSIPVAGKAFEVIDAVRTRHAMLAQGERLEEIERQMSRMDRRLRDLVEEEIRMTLQRLGEPALDGPTLTAEIRNLRSIQQQGWEPTLFEGLLRNSSHWNELKSRPQHYGRVLDAQAKIDLDGIHVLIDADPLRVLELTPFAFAALLANQSQGVPGAEIQAKADIWAFPTSADWRKGKARHLVHRPETRPHRARLVPDGHDQEADRSAQATVPRVPRIDARVVGCRAAPASRPDHAAIFPGNPPGHARPVPGDHGQSGNWCQSLMPPCGTRNDENGVGLW